MAKRKAKKDFKDMSDKRCAGYSSKLWKGKGCKAMLKQRIVDIKPTADLCYRCHTAKLATEGRNCHRKAIENDTRFTGHKSTPTEKKGEEKS